MMLQQTAELETEAAQIRVTPQELVQATAAIEARQDAHAQLKASTIPIGEAVQQLNLNATPEEVLAEVRAQRAGTQTQQTGVKQKRLPLNKSVKIMRAIIAAQFLVIALLGFRFVEAQTYIRNLQWQMQAHTPVQSPNANADVIRKMNPQLFRSLDLTEGQSAQCGMENIHAMARGAAPAQIWVAKNMDQYNWTLSRQAGKLCVQCWVTPADATLIANGQPAYVGAYKSGDATTAITLPLERFANAIDMPANFGRGVSSVQVN